MVFSNFENSGNMYKKVLSPILGYQGQLKRAKFTKKL